MLIKTSNHKLQNPIQSKDLGEPEDLFVVVKNFPLDCSLKTKLTVVSNLMYPHPATNLGKNTCHHPIINMLWENTIYV